MELFVEIVNVNYFHKKTTSQMFDWVPNTSLSLDSYFLLGLNSLYVLTVVPECFRNSVEMQQFQEYNVAQDCSFKEILSLKFKIVFPFLTQRISVIVFWESFIGFRICCMIVVTSYNNNAVLHKITQQIFAGLEDVLKTSSRHVLKTSSTHLQRNNFWFSKTS